MLCVQVLPTLGLEPWASELVHSSRVHQGRLDQVPLDPVTWQDLRRKEGILREQCLGGGQCSFYNFHSTSSLLFNSLASANNGKKMTLAAITVLLFHPVCPNVIDAPWVTWVTTHSFTG